jgi:Co/Zn/Cd efflux system component
MSLTATLSRASGVARWAPAASCLAPRRRWHGGGHGHGHHHHQHGVLPPPVAAARGEGGRGASPDRGAAAQPAPPAAAMDADDEAARRVGVRVTLFGAVCNVLLAAGKGSVGAATGSAALVADAAHSLSDLFSDAVTTWAVYWAREPADASHPVRVAPQLLGRSC